MVQNSPAQDRASAVLGELRRLAGGPSYRQLSGYVEGLSPRSVGNLLDGSTESRPTTIAGFIAACLEHARRFPRGARLQGEQAEARYWHRRYEQAMDRPARIDGQRVCPYPGLAAFGRNQARWFHGREALISTLVDRLDQRRDRGGLQMVVAPSGAGKSSLLHAGLIPKLASGALPGSKHWPVAVLTPTARPLEALAAALVDQDKDATDMELPADTAGWLARARSLGDPAVDDRRVLVVVDQLEELFTTCSDPEQRQVFLQVLAALAAPQPAEDAGPVAVVILGVRADFYPACVQEPVLHAALQDHHLAVGPLSASELRDAILLPAHDVGLVVEPGLVDILLADLGGVDDGRADHAANYAADRLPLLAHALRACWQQREGNTLTVAGYRITGGIRGAIQKTADDVYQRLDPTGQRIAEMVFRRLVAIGDHTDDTRRRRTRTELLDTSSDPTVAERVLDMFTEARLLTMHRDTVQITHEALLRAWPQLQHWINTDRADRLLHQELLDTAAIWHRTRDKTLLLRGGRLHTARSWAARAPIDELTTVIPALLTTSIRHHRVGRGLRYGGVIGLVIATVAAIIFGIDAQSNARTAQEQHALALSRQLAFESRAVNARAPVLARQLALAALAAARTPEATTNLEELLNEQQRGVLIGHRDDELSGVAFSPDGSILASAGRDGVRLWNVRTFQPIATPPGNDFAFDLQFSPDGTILATAGWDNTVRLWDVRTRQPIGGRLKASTAGGVESLEFSPDGTILATAGWDNTVRLWDVRSGQALGGPLTAHTGPVLDVTFNQAGTIIASASEDQTVRLWDVRTHQPLGAPLAGHTNTVAAVAFSRDDTALVSAGRDHTVRLWNASTGQPIGIPLDNTGIGGPLALNRDGTVLASGGPDDTVRLWDVRTGEPIGTPMAGHADRVRVVSFNMDGTVLASAGKDQTVRLWDVRTRQPFGDPWVGHRELVEVVAFNRDSTVLASGSRDDTVRLWDVRTHQPIGSPLTGHTDDVVSVAFSPDGTILASASKDKTIRLWDVRTHQPIGSPLTGHTSPLLDMAFSPDGTLLASASEDQTVRLWDVQARQAVGAPLTGHTEDVLDVAFSPDGAILASASLDYTLRLWNVRTRQPIGSSLVGHADGVWAVTFTPDGTMLASASKDDTLRLWDVRTRQPIGSPIVSRTHGVWDVAYSPDGTTLATSGDIHEVRLWDFRTRQTVGAPIPGALPGPAFNSDGTFLATANGDGTVGLWRVRPYQDPIGSVCEDLGGINPETWNAHAPGELLPALCQS
jgi:WD40 repeat protein